MMKVHKIFAVRTVGPHIAFLEEISSNDRNKGDIMAYSHSLKRVCALMSGTCALVLVIGVGCGGSEWGPLEGESGKAEVMGPFDPFGIAIKQGEDGTSMRITSEKDPSVSTEFTKTPENSWKYNLPGGTVTLSPDGAIESIDISDAKEFVTALEKLNQAGLMVMGSVEGQSDEEQLSQLEDEGFVEGGMMMQLLEASENVPFGEWWGEEGLNFMKGIGIGMAAGAGIVASLHFLILAVEAQAAALAVEGAVGGEAAIIMDLHELFGAARLQMTKMEIVNAMDIAEARLTQLCVDQVTSTATLAKASQVAAALVANVAGGLTTFGLLAADEQDQAQLGSCSADGCDLSNMIDPLFELMQ